MVQVLAWSGYQHWCTLSVVPRIRKLKSTPCQRYQTRMSRSACILYALGNWQTERSHSLPCNTTTCSRRTACHTGDTGGSTDNGHFFSSHPFSSCFLGCLITSVRFLDRSRHLPCHNALWPWRCHLCGCSLWRPD